MNKNDLPGTVFKIPSFSSYLFWDVNPEEFDYKKNRLFVIERVTTKGTEEDWQELKRYYGWETLKKEIVLVPYLDNKTWNFLSVIFGIPKEEFKCYKSAQSRKSYWNLQKNYNKLIP
jgi:hypothetical protein